MDFYFSFFQQGLVSKAVLFPQWCKQKVFQRVTFATFWHTEFHNSSSLFSLFNLLYLAYLVEMLSNIGLAFKY